MDHKQHVPQIRDCLKRRSKAAAEMVERARAATRTEFRTESGKNSNQAATEQKREKLQPRLN
jgi:hypothetical protein